MGVLRAWKRSRQVSMTRAGLVLPVVGGSSPVAEGSSAGLAEVALHVGDVLPLSLPVLDDAPRAAVPVGAPQGGWAQAEGKFKYQGDQFRPVDRVVFDEYVHVLENNTIHTLTLPTVFGTRTTRNPTKKAKVQKERMATELDGD